MSWLNASNRTSKMMVIILAIIATVMALGAGIYISRSITKPVDDMIQEIAASAQEQSASVEEVTASVDSVSAISEESAAGTQEASAATEELTASMENLMITAEELSHLSEELQMAASHFVTRSADDFIRCWDIKKCSNEVQKKCPAYDSKEKRCWLIEGTWCGGVKQGDARAKIHNCMNCDAFKKNTDAE